MLIAVGCSQSLAPTELNPGIPPGAREGGYGFYVNSRHFDNENSSFNDGNASIRPYVIEGSGAVILSVSLYYNFSDGSFGIIDLSIPFIAPKAESFQFSDVSSPWTLNAVGYVNHDSGGYISYVSIPGGALNITKFDTVNNLVSGTFELTTYETYPTTDLHNTIGITNGYFNDIPIDQGSYGQGSITALLNGTPFNSDNDGVEMVYTDSEFNGIDLFDYGPEMGNDSFISIQRIPMRTGMYVMDSITARSDTMPIIIFQNWGNLQRDASTQSAESTGQLTITSCDIAHRRISGTFQFSGVDSLGDTVTITNGVINNVQWEP